MHVWLCVIVIQGSNSDMVSGRPRCEAAGQYSVTTMGPVRTPHSPDRPRPHTKHGSAPCLQAAVAAALALVDADALRAGAPAPTDGPARALDFAAERLADGRATAPPDGLLRVLAYIALGPWPADAEVQAACARMRVANPESTHA